MAKMIPLSSDYTHFSAPYLWRICKFYNTYVTRQFLAPLAREIGWVKNPSIDMILCREKKRTIVEYALKESNKPIGVAAYSIVQWLLVNLKGKLPDPKQTERLLEAVELSKGKDNASTAEGG